MTGNKAFEEDPAGPEQNTVMAAGTRIMISGPGPDLRACLREILERAGYAIAGEASNGEQAVAMALALDPSLIVMDGMDAAHSIRVQHPAMKIVIITQEAKPSDALRIMKAGVLNFIIKPFQEQQVLDVVRHALDC